ncbi:MAG: CBS domain-containing protein [Candidatus Aenigmatarchaeota archaeon]
MKRVRDFMNKEVIFFTPNDSIFEVARIFSERGISGAPVVERNKVIGIVSESDIVRFMCTRIGKSFSKIPTLSTLLFSVIIENIEVKKELEKISKINVKDVMSRDVISISPEKSIFDAASLMEKKDVNRLPVIEDGRLVGIVTRADLIRALISEEKNEKSKCENSNY